MERMRVALFSNRESAEAILRRLSDAGMAAHLTEKPAMPRLWLVSAASVGVRIDVPADQFERSEQLLLAWDAAENALRNAIRCPECKSLRVDYPQFARHSVLTNFGLGLVSEIGLVERDYYCEDCHFTWPKEGTRSRGRHNMAPYYFIEGIEQTGRSGTESRRDAV
jgi:hypothetical protein